MIDIFLKHVIRPIFFSYIAYINKFCMTVHPVTIVLNLMNLKKIRYIILLDDTYFMSSHVEMLDMLIWLGIGMDCP